MNYYQIQPTDYIDKLINEELYQKSGAFQNYWRLFYKYYVKDNDITKVEDGDIEHFKGRYSKRTLAKVFNVKSKDTAGRWRDEFIDIIENFVAHWILKSQKNVAKDKSVQNQGSHSLATDQPVSSQRVATRLANDDVEKSTENTQKNEGQEKLISHLDSQQVATDKPKSSHSLAKYITNNNNINNNKKINKEWLESFLSALSKVSKQVYQKRYEFESVFMSLLTLYDDVEEVIEWASKNDFWMDKLIDPRSIKRNYEKMRLQMLKEKSKKPLPNGPDKVEQVKRDIELLKAVYEKKQSKEVV
jgi:hypothetical protein